MQDLNKLRMITRYNNFRTLHAFDVLCKRMHNKRYSIQERAICSLWKRLNLKFENGRNCSALSLGIHLGDSHKFFLAFL